jgi:probable O-glycosylation ligase (exosortase A-associated)
VPIRDVVLFAVLLGALPVCLVRPYIGVLLWAWLGYMNPHRLTWGSAHDFPFALAVAIATLAGFAFTVVREQRFPKISWERETILLLLLWGMFILTTFFALRPDFAWPALFKISKILLMTFLTILLITDERKLRYLFLIIALSLGFYGLKGGIFSIARGGLSRVYGPEGSFIADNNAMGLALNMTLPFLFYLAKTERNWYLKRFLQVTFFSTIISVLFTYSRGALLGLVVVLGLLFLALKLRTKIAVAMITIPLILVVMSQIPDIWFDRMDTIATYQEDSSALGRIEAWKASWRLALDRPLVGGGFNALYDPQIYLHYNPDITLMREGHPDTQGAHSSYFEVLGENGFITFGIFVMLLASSIVSLRKVRRVSRENGQQRFCYYSNMLEVSLFGYAVSGAFLEFASFDLLYHVIACVILLKVLLHTEILRHAPMVPNSGRRIPQTRT